MASRDKKKTETPTEKHVEKDLKKDDEGMCDIGDLINVLIDTLTASLGEKRVNRRNALLVFVQNYDKLIKEGDSVFEDHSTYFLNVYKEHRDGILDEGFDWIENNGIIIWFGENIPKVKKANIKLPISAVFNKAVQLREQFENQLRKKKRNDKTDENEDYQFYPDEILYYLMRIFRRAIEGTKYSDDIPDIDEIIKELHQAAAIDSKEPASDRPKQRDRIIEAVTNAVKKAGPKDENGNSLIEGVDNVDTNQVTDLLVNLFNNKDVTDRVSTAVTNVSKGKDSQANTGEVLSEVFKEITPVIINNMSTMMPVPPGVTDTRTPEQLQKDNDKVKKTLGTIATAVGELTSE